MVKSRTQALSICLCGPDAPEPTGDRQSESGTGRLSPSPTGYQSAHAGQTGRKKIQKMKSAPDGLLKTKGQKSAPDEFMKIKGLRDISNEAGM